MSRWSAGIPDENVISVSAALAGRLQVHLIPVLTVLEKLDGRIAPRLTFSQLQCTRYASVTQHGLDDESEHFRAVLGTNRRRNHDLIRQRGHCIKDAN